MQVELSSLVNFPFPGLSVLLSEQLAYFGFAGLRPSDTPMMSCRGIYAYRLGAHDLYNFFLCLGY